MASGSQAATEAASMTPASTQHPTATPGAVQALGDNCFRACLQRRSAGGSKEYVYGPRRSGKRKAEEDLEAIRAVARGPEAWSAATAEGHRLQERALFEARVAMRAAEPARTIELTIPPADWTDLPPEDMYDWEPYDDSQDYATDVNELWQEIDEEGRLHGYQPPPMIPVPDPKDAVDATALLSKFQPTRCTVEDLKKLLDARADPNIIIGDDISPLFKVLGFAHADRVGAMRDLLLQAGAVENNAAKERWVIRRNADACEDAWMRNFHRDPALVPYECL